MAKCVPCVFSSGSDYRISPTASKTLSVWGFIASGFTALALVFFVQSSAFAHPSFLTFFNSKYGTGGTAIDTCNLCHTAGFSLNPYGQDFKDAGGDGAALDAIASIDSDADGATNITEINALTFPGDPASMPPQAPAGLPVPDAQSIYSYQAVTSPVISETAESARPIGLGQVAVGGSTVDVSLGLAETAGPVDVYFGLQINGSDILILTSNGQFQSISAGPPVPFFAGSMQGFNQSLFGAINVSVLPPATYTLYMMITPAGSFSNFYLYITGFTVAGP